MPHQVFCDRNGDEIVLVRWDFALTVVEVVLRGAPLARIGDLGRLRSEFGMTGPTPDGHTLTIWAVRSSGGESFEITIEGEPLRPGTVSWSDPVESVIDTATLRRSDRKAVLRQQDELRKVRGWPSANRRPLAMIAVATIALIVGGVFWGWPRVREANKKDTKEAVAVLSPNHPAPGSTQAA